MTTTTDARAVTSTAPTRPSRAEPSWLCTNWGLLLGVAALVAIALLPTPDGLPVAGQRMLAILALQSSFG